MIVERHYDDETLIGLLGSNLDPMRDPHLSVCSSCSDNLESYRAIAETLGHDAAWDLRDLRQEPAPETMSRLREVSSVLAAEEEIAEAAVARLLEQPRSSWPATIADTPDLQTPSAVKALVGASETSIDRDPAEALAIALLATRAAELLSAGGHDKESIFRATGAAWRQHAYASFYVGEYPAASESVSKARLAFESCTISDYDLARLSIVRGLILASQERHEEARAEARHATTVFEAFGDRSRAAAAMVAEAFSYLHQLRYPEALQILKAIEEGYSAEIDNSSRANVALNLGICYSELGRVPEAFDHYSMAAAIYDEIGNLSEAARVRHNVACLLAAQGRLSDAKARFRSLRMEYRRLGIASGAVAADLDLAELLLAENEHDEAEALCAAAVEQFRGIGLSETTQGLTALTYLREAAAQRRATPQAARHVRRYIERLPEEPQLLFAPPPL